MVGRWGWLLTRLESGLGLLELILSNQVECVVRVIRNVLLFLTLLLCSSCRLSCGLLSVSVAIALSELQAEHPCGGQSHTDQVLEPAITK